MKLYHGSMAGKRVKLVALLDRPSLQLNVNTGRGLGTSMRDGRKPEDKKREHEAIRQIYKGNSKWAQSLLSALQQISAWIGKMQCDLPFLTGNHDRSLASAAFLV